jgi:peptidyl-prolyl cis-trans isomerase B (cyclophilin B)
VAKGGYEKRRVEQKKAAAKRARHRAKRNRTLLIWGSTLGVIALIVLITLIVIGGDDEGSLATGTDGCQTATPAGPKEQYDAAPTMTIDTNKTYTATFATSCGDIKVELFDDQAPTTVNSFVFLARDGFYDGTAFHRVIADFAGDAMVQGGDGVKGDGTGDPGYEFEDENTIPLDQPGYLAMANSGPGTNGSQFFFLHGTVDHLNAAGQCPGPQGCHSVFGKVTEGLDVLATIGAVQTATGDRPVADVIIRSLTITES